MPVSSRNHRPFKSRYSHELTTLGTIWTPIARPHDLLPKDHDEIERARRVLIYAEHVEKYGRVRFDLLGPKREEAAKPEPRRMFRLDQDVVIEECNDEE